MTLRYLLDTNIISALVRNPQGPVTARVAEVGEGALCTSIIVAAELRFGAVKKGSARLSAQLEIILGALPILSLEAPVDATYAQIRASLEAGGQPIGANDLLIAAHAVTLGLALVTDNEREFGKVPGLVWENWLR